MTSHDGQGTDAEPRPRRALSRSSSVGPGSARGLPDWVPLVVSIVIGVFAGAAAANVPGAWIFLPGMLGLVVIDWFLTRHRWRAGARVIDERSVGGQVMAYALALVPILVLLMIQPGMWFPGVGRWVVGVVIGVVAGLGAHAYLRWDERDQGSRRAAGAAERA